MSQDSCMQGWHGQFHRLQCPLITSTRIDNPQQTSKVVLFSIYPGSDHCDMYSKSVCLCVVREGVVLWFIVMSRIKRPLLRPTKAASEFG